MDERKRMEELVALLNEASRAYYAEDREIMPNVTYDSLYDELVALEQKSGTVLSGSPTLKVGYESVDFLPKEEHASPMLSLQKTKSREELAAWLGEQEGLLSWKEDGLTVVLTYRNGSLEKCVTRGNGEVGEVVTANARTFINLPLQIAFKGELIVRGEAVISYSDFEEINRSIPEEGAKYRNPRNLCSGSVRQLDSSVTASRKVRVMIFSLVSAVDENGKDADFRNSMEEEFRFLHSLGFQIVEYERVNSANIIEAISRFEEKIATNDIPSDGLVLSYDDLAYARSLGRTAKFPRGAIAFKWADEMAKTQLQEVEWNTSRTGLINPVAIFQPVELEGTIVSRASLHNVSIIRQLKLGIGDELMVYKANMIIPQIAENLSGSDNLEIPRICPACGGTTMIEKEVDSEVLRCQNPDCPAKQLKIYVHFVERDAMNIEGLSEATLEKMLGMGLIHSFSDFYKLSEKREELLHLEGFKERSADKLLSAIEKSRSTTLPRVLNAIGIPGIGLATARILSLHFDEDPATLLDAGIEELSAVEGMGDVLAAAFYDYMHDPGKRVAFISLLDCLSLAKIRNDNIEQSLSGKVFVITGSLEHFANRGELKTKIEEKGGKVASKVSARTECLINNDATSRSAKNKDAAALGVKILTEKEFLTQYLNESV